MFNIYLTNDDQVPISEWTKISSGDNSKQIRVHVTGIKYLSPYAVRIAAVNSVGQGPLSELIEFDTKVTSEYY